MKDAWRIISWLFLMLIKAFLILTGFAIALALLVALGEFYKTTYSTISLSAASTWILFIGIGTVLLLLAVAARSVFSFLASPFGSWNLFGDTVASRLIGLGVVAFLFPRTVVALITVPIQVLVQLFWDITQGVGRLSQPGPVNDQGAVSGDQIVWSLQRLMQGIFSDLSRAISQLFNQISLYECVLALALWVIIGQLLQTRTGGGGESPVRLIAYFQNLKDEQRRNLWIGIVFFIGIYLSIAAIVAIPWLSEDKAPQTMTRERLEKALEAVTPPAEEAGSGASAEPPDPFLQLEETLRKISGPSDTPPPTDNTAATSQDRTVTSNLVEEIRQGMNYARMARQNLHDRWHQLRDQIRQRQGQVVREALNAYETEMLLPMSAQERAFFYRDIVRSVQNQVADMQGSLRECMQAVSEADKQVEVLISEASASLARSNLKSNLFLTPRTGSFVLLPSLINTRGCSAVSLRPIQYTAPDPGATWGPFAVVAQWLLRTKSSALALITGMLGFGLLGAAIATFIRPPGTNTASSPAGEAATIIIRGLAAAIVIFLAAKGGLAIVSTNDAEPNAYVLFFTCLVGAVFSEGVWTWAKAKLESILENGAGSP